MRYSDFLAKLIFLTKRNNISQAEIGEAIGLDRGASNARAQRDSKFKPAEIERIEQTFDVNLSSVSIMNNSGERHNDVTVDEKSSQFGKRLSVLQEKHNFLDKEMAKLLKISEKEYLALVCGNLEPDLQVLNRIKQNFKVSIDYLLYGE